MPLDIGDDRRFMAMPAYIGGPFDLMGMKWYGSNMSNRDKGLPRSILTVMLNDKDTGAPLALMSANLLSAYRTGAIPGVGAKYLVKKDAKVCSICGPGVMGKTSLSAIMAVCKKIDTLKVKGRGKASLDKFIEYVKEEYPTLKSVEAVDTVEDLIRDADVVSFANSGGTDPSKYPFVKKEWIKPGAVLIGVSAFDMDAQELKTCSLVVDNIKLYEAWAEEFPYPSFGANNIIGSKFTDMAHDGLIKMDEITDLGDIIFKKKPGRTSDEQIFVYSVGGMPVEDVAWGKICYENARRLGLGTKLRLWNEPDMH
jgi:ornithine cyclodeaminase